MNNKNIKNRIITFGMCSLMIAGISCATGLDDRSSEVVYAAEGEVQGDATEGDADQIYCIGSVSKVYVTTAVMQLVEQGKVDLDAPVTDYIDDFKMADERYKDITVRMLMNHTSGIFGSSLKNSDLYGDNSSVSTENTLKNLENQRLKADPGEYAAYCNDGFTLLELLVERVSGMSYTDYVEKNIAGKLGAENIYTAKNVFGNPALADIFPDSNNRYETEYSMDFGSGGIYSTALDTCEFGSTFFKGDNRLLSEGSKNEMATLWSSTTDASGNLKYDPDYMDQNGLGWDMVDIPMYEEAGVKALYKGGDNTDYHAGLLVLPDEEVSVCVTTSGGSSGYNMAMAEALANIVLEEQGIEVEETTAPEVELKETVPDSYKKYEGYYSLDGAPAEITFPDMKYALVKMLGAGTSDEYYMYTDNGFVRVTGDIEAGEFRVDPDYFCINFVEAEGHVYITEESVSKQSGLVNGCNRTYSGEKLEPYPVSEEAIKAWQERDGMKYAVESEKYSSAVYQIPFTEIRVLEDSGYVVNFGMATRILKIVDENHLEAFTTIPSSGNRDIFDIYVDDTGVVHASTDLEVVPVTDNESFTADVKEVSLTTEKAVWFNIDDSMANKNISLERPDNSAVYVYDKFGKVKYSTHMIDYGDVIHLPKEGYIMFIGETGDTIRIR
ncbi:MAG: beta-lactamase family protein [Eubacterium sp.]|nr:beta-lactamase family protein [Eubacterium sp.]